MGKPLHSSIVERNILIPVR